MTNDEQPTHCSVPVYSATTGEPVGYATAEAAISCHAPESERVSS